MIVGWRVNLELNTLDVCVCAVGLNFHRENPMIGGPFFLRAGIGLKIDPIGDSQLHLIAGD